MLASEMKKSFLAGVGVLLVGCSATPSVSVSGDYEDIHAAETVEMAKEKCEQIRPGSEPAYAGWLWEKEEGTLTYDCLPAEQLQGGNDLLIDVIRTTVTLF